MDLTRVKSTRKRRGRWVSWGFCQEGCLPLDLPGGRRADCSARSADLPVEGPPGRCRNVPSALARGRGPPGRSASGRSSGPNALRASAGPVGCWRRGREILPRRHCGGVNPALRTCLWMIVRRERAARKRGAGWRARVSGSAATWRGSSPSGAEGVPGLCPGGGAGRPNFPPGAKAFAPADRSKRSPGAF